MVYYRRPGIFWARSCEEPTVSRIKALVVAACPLIWCGLGCRAIPARVVLGLYALPAANTPKHAWVEVWWGDPIKLTETFQIR